MQSTLSVKNMILYSALSAGIALIGIPTAGVFIIFWLSERLPGHIRETTPAIFLQFLILFLMVALGGAVWSLALRRKVRRGSFWHCVLAGGLGFTLICLVIALGLGRLEVLLVEERALPSLAMHVIFGLLFTPSAALICGSMVFLVGSAFLPARRAARSGLWCGLGGAAAFLLTQIIMHPFGWVVGGPNAAASATMLVVMLCGFLATALVGGGLFGWRLGQETHSS